MEERHAEGDAPRLPGGLGVTEEDTPGGGVTLRFEPRLRLPAFWLYLAPAGLVWLYAVSVFAASTLHGRPLGDGLELGVGSVLMLVWLLTNSRPAHWRLSERALEVERMPGSRHLGELTALGVSRCWLLPVGPWTLIAREGASAATLMAGSRRQMLALGRYVAARTGMPFDEEAGIERAGWRDAVDGATAISASLCGIACLALLVYGAWVPALLGAGASLGLLGAGALARRVG